MSFSELKKKANMPEERAGMKGEPTVGGTHALETLLGGGPCCGVHFQALVDELRYRCWAVQWRIDARQPAPLRQLARDDVPQHDAQAVYVNLRAIPAG